MDLPLVFTMGKVPAVHQLQELQQSDAGGRDEVHRESSLREQQGQRVRRGQEDDILPSLQTGGESHQGGLFQVPITRTQSPKLSG